MPYSVTICKTCEYLTDSPEHGPEDEYCEAPDGFETIELFTEREVQARLATAQLESELKEEVQVYGLRATLEAGARITLEDGHVVSVPLRVAADGVGVMLRVDAQAVAEQVRARIEGRAVEDDMPHWVTLDDIDFRGGGVMGRRRGREAE